MPKKQINVSSFPNCPTLRVSRDHASSKKSDEDEMCTLNAPRPCRLSQPKWAHSPQIPQFTQSPAALLFTVKPLLLVKKNPRERKRELQL